MTLRFSGMRWIKFAVLFIFFFINSLFSFAQVTGGQFAFQSLTLPNSPHVSALGGISVANPDNDIALALQNPAMMRPGLHNMLDLNYNDYYASIGILNLQYGYYVPHIKTCFFLGIQYINYGTFTETDNVGNIYGSFHASDYAITFGASRSYGKHWRYGAAIKMAHSALYTYKANAIATDVGVNYYDTTKLLDIGAVAKNMGVMTKKYTSGQPSEPIPFDLQLGISKKFKHMPLRMFATIHHLYEWDIRYANPTDDSATNSLNGSSDTVRSKGTYFSDKLFRHFIFGAELLLGKHLTITASYNYLVRKELALSSSPGPTGFAFGLGVNLSKFQVHYARSYYYVSGPYNEIGLTMALNKLMGFGEKGEKIHWTSEYPDWEEAE